MDHTHEKCAHRKNRPGVHTASAGTDTQTHTCVDLTPWVRDRGVYAQQQRWGWESPSPRSAAAHLRDGNLPLQRTALFLQEGPGTWTVQHQKQRCRPGSQLSPPRGPNPQPPQEPPLGPPISVHLSLCCPHAVPAQPCSPASFFLGRVCPVSLPASQCPP